MTPVASAFDIVSISITSCLRGGTDKEKPCKLECVEPIPEGIEGQPGTRLLDYLR